MAVARPEEAQAGCAKSEPIEQLFAALESPLLAYALRLVEDMALAEDIIQEAFLRLHRQQAEVREPRRWLYRTVHNQAINHRRQRGRLVPLESLTEGGSGGEREYRDLQPLPDEQIARMEHIGLVRLSLRALDERSRQLVQLKFNEGLSYKEIAARTGLTIGHVGYLLHYALKAVAAELAKAGLVP